MNIGILSRNTNLVSTKRLMEAAIERGHHAKVINFTKCYVGIEHDNSKIYFGDHELEPLDAIIPRIGASVTFYGANLIRQFEFKNIFSTTSAVGLMRSRDKLRSLQLLASANVNIPKTAFAKYPNDIKNLIKIVGGAPLVIKLLESTQGKGVVLAETAKAAESVIGAFYDLDENIIVQEFIKESKAEDIRAFVVDNKVVGAMKRKGVEGEFRSNLHKGGTASIVELSKEEEMTALAAAAAMDLGIAGVDMLRSDRGPLVIEVNSSPGLQGIERATGIDIAGKIIEFIEKEVGKAK